MTTHRARRFTTGLRTACLLCLLLLTLALVSSGQKATADDVPALIRNLKDKNARVRAEVAGRLIPLEAEAKAAALALNESQ